MIGVAVQLPEIRKNEKKILRVKKVTTPFP